MRLGLTTDKMYCGLIYSEQFKLIVTRAQCYEHRKNKSTKNDIIKKLNEPYL